MVTYPYLEIRLSHRLADGYNVELRYSAPGDDADPQCELPNPVQFDLTDLKDPTLSATKCGGILSNLLFNADPQVRAFYNRMRGQAESQGVPLRLRLRIDASAAALHPLRWETLRDPDNDQVSLVTNDGVLFSRYLSSADSRPVHPRARGDLTALVAIANPTNLAQYQPGGRALAAVDVPGELERARASLAGIPVKALAAPEPVTLERLSGMLRTGRYDILYLVCHGALINGESRLALETEDRLIDWVSGGALIEQLAELTHRPRLVVLASCQSAGQDDAARTDDGGVLAALGPRLASAAGLPAVVAMQGNVTMRTVEAFMPPFFTELRKSGQIDQAMSVARRAVRDRDDCWAPVLFMRLESGRIWYDPHLSGSETDRFNYWNSLRSSIQNGTCTPILGPGVTESLLGPRQELAQSWADRYGYPLAPYDKENLLQVAQYVAVDQSRDFMRNELLSFLRQRALKELIPDIFEREPERKESWADIVRREPGLKESWAAIFAREPALQAFWPNSKTELAPILAATPETVPLPSLLAAAGRKVTKRHPQVPHTLLAGLSCPIYVTTNPDNLLLEALREANKTPVVEVCQWHPNPDPDPVSALTAANADHVPDVAHPLVFHLFGHIDDPRSLVLTEDDYFDYLIGVTRNREWAPPRVKRALAQSALLFLGFQMNDWSLRVLLHIIRAQQGSDRLSDYTHVAVQIEPQEGRTAAPERAQRFLETYFQKPTSARLSIFWGSVEDFMQELQRQL